MNYRKRADTELKRLKSEVSRKEKSLRLNYWQRCSGKFVKPPCGAFVKNIGTERHGQSKCNQFPVYRQVDTINTSMVFAEELNSGKSL